MTSFSFSSDMVRELGIYLLIRSAGVMAELAFNGGEDGGPALVAENGLILRKKSIDQRAIAFAERPGQSHQFQTGLVFQGLGMGSRRFKQPFLVGPAQCHGDDIGGALGGQ